MGLRLEGAALLELLAHPAHGGDAITRKSGDLAGAFALFVELENSFPDRQGDGFHAPILP